MTYYSAFKSKSVFPRPIERTVRQIVHADSSVHSGRFRGIERSLTLSACLQIQGGGIQATFDSRMQRDAHGKYLIMENSIAQDALGTMRTYASVSQMPGQHRTRTCLRARNL